MFILLTLGIFILKFLALGVVGLFFAEDLELTRSVGGGIYSAYFALGVCAFLHCFSLFSANGCFGSSCSACLAFRILECTTKRPALARFTIKTI